MPDIPGAVLFTCTMNAVRSPMAAAIMRYFHGHRVFVDSCGVRIGQPDPFATAALDEIGIDLTNHQPKSFDQLDNDFFDLVISLSPEAQHSAVELTRTSAIELEFWHMPDPSLTSGSREMRLRAYRELRDTLMHRIRTRFPLQNKP
jgi:protein-tyrosine-phosphatase